MKPWIRLRFTLNQALALIDLGIDKKSGVDVRRSMVCTYEDCEEIMARVHRTDRTSKAIRLKVAKAMRGGKRAVIR